jgi:hypothetical protein
VIVLNVCGRDPRVNLNAVNPMPGKLVNHQIEEPKRRLIHS